MPNTQTPEQRRAYRARCLAEGRCGNCGVTRAPTDTQTTNCRKCRNRKNRRGNERYAAERAADPPMGVSPAPDVPFAYGKTRLQNPRRVFVSCDSATRRAVIALIQHYRARPGYESYSVSRMLRHCITVQNDVTGGHVPPRAPLPRTFYGQLFLCFLADAPAWNVIERQQRATNATIADAVRALIVNAHVRFLCARPAVACKGHILTARRAELWDNH